MPARRRTKRKSSGGLFSGNTLLGLFLLACLLGLLYLIETGVIDLRDFGIDPAVIGLEPTATPRPVVSSDGADGAIEVFFTTPALIYPDVARDRIPPPHEQAILADIEAAETSIDMATFEFNLTSIADALARAEERGVTVRLALDEENLEKPEMAEWAGIVEEANIPVSWQESDAFLHSKFIIIDQEVVWTGSWNATNNDTYRNNNNLLRLTVPELVENYQTEFNQMEGGNFSTSKSIQTPYPSIDLGGITIENYFSPREKPAPRVAEVISQAQASVKFLAFSYTSDPIADAMIERQAAGIPVQGVFEARNAEGLGSEYAKLLDNDIEVLKDGNCYTMHHKVIIIDDQIVITGSYNFTARAEDTNDENLLIIDDAALAQAYVEEFDRVFGQAQNPTRCGS